jgi:hypothetical protein
LSAVFFEDVAVESGALGEDDGDGVHAAFLVFDAFDEVLVTLIHGRGAGGKSSSGVSSTFRTLKSLLVGKVETSMV